MAATKTPTIPDTIEETATRLRDVNQNLIGFAKESGQAYLDTYGAAVQAVVEFERTAASHSQIEWLGTVTNTHAKMVEDITTAYLKVARETLR